MTALSRLTYKATHMHQYVAIVQQTSDQIKKFNLSMTLISTVSDIPAHNMLFISGYFNAKIGPMEASLLM